MSTAEERPSSLSLSFVEGLYADYLSERESVSPDWRRYFDELSYAGSNGADHGAAFRPTFEPKPLPAFVKSRAPDENGFAPPTSEPQPAATQPIERTLATPDAVAAAQAEA